MVYRPKIDDSLCFVLMPFREPFDGYYRDIIKKAVKAAGLEPLRGDEIFGTKPIIHDVWEHIWRARVVIADVTDRNPNVNYELGLCHSLGVSTILITKRIEDVPFDYRHRRCIVYNTEEATWVEKLSTALGNTMRAVLSEKENEQELRWPYDTFDLQSLDGSRSTISVENPRQMILRGMAEVERLVAKAFGPRGLNISVRLSPHQVVSHKEGLVIARGVRSANPIEENGIDQMREIGRIMSRRVGDGTKTAMLLARALADKGLSAISQGYPLPEVLDGMEKAVIAVRSSILGRSRACTQSDLAAVALTASGEPELSELVIQAMTNAGKDGIILIETEPGTRARMRVQEGLRFDRGFLSENFVTDAGSGECALSNCRVLVYEFKISNMRDLLPLLEEVAHEGDPLLVIADDVEGEALATLVVNHVRGTIHCAAVRAPGAGNRRKALLQDIAVLTGARPPAAELGQRLESVRLADLGRAEKVIVTKDETTIFGGHGPSEAVVTHVKTLRSAIDRSRDPEERERLQERLANLAGQIAVVSVGGTTEIDVEERRYRAASALFSTRAAIEEGCICGGGIAFLNAKEAVAALVLQPGGEAAGASAVSAALDAPFLALAASCGKSPVTLQNEIQRLAQPEMGVNVKTGNIENLVVSGVLDPTKTLILAINTAFSYARSILKTDIWSVSPLQSEEARRGDLTF